MIVAQFLRHPPASAQKAIAATQREFTTMEILRTPHFYAIYVAQVMMAPGGLLVTANAGPIAQSWGIPAGALALATSWSALANGASRLGWGWLSDRIGRELTMGIAFASQAICLLLVLTIGRVSGSLFTLTLVLTFLTWGETFSLFRRSSAITTARPTRPRITASSTPPKVSPRSLPAALRRSCSNSSAAGAPAFTAARCWPSLPR